MTAYLDVMDLGIDIGGSTCKVSVVQDSEPALVQGEAGNYYIPSAVFIEENEVIIGEEAVAHRPLDPHRFHQLDKREIGTDRVYEISGEEYTPKDIIEILAAGLISNANRAVDDQVQGATIACPCSVGIRTREAIRDAVTRGGLSESKLIAEPLAACLGHGIDTDEANGSEILVYDLGHQSFDATIVTVTNQGFEIVAGDGDSTLGGKPIGDRLYKYANSEILNQCTEKDSLSEIEKANIRLEIKDAKEELSVVDQTRISTLIDGQIVAIKITRDYFEELIDDMIRETITIIDNLIEAAPTEKSNIENIILVGGTTRIPLIRQRVEEYFAIKPTIDVDPTEAVAKGAAIAADQDEPDDTVVI